MTYLKNVYINNNKIIIQIIYIAPIQKAIGALREHFTLHYKIVHPQQEPY